MKSFRMADLFTLLLGVRGSSFRKRMREGIMYLAILHFSKSCICCSVRMLSGDSFTAATGTSPYISWGIPTTAASSIPSSLYSSFSTSKLHIFSPPGLSCPFPVHDKQIPLPVKISQISGTEPAVSVQLPGSLLIIPVQENRPPDCDFPYLACLHL